MKNIYLPSLEVSIPQEVEIYYKRPLFNSMVHITSSRDAYCIMRKCIHENRIDHKEFFWVLLLNRANRLLAFSEIGVGSDTGVVINHKEIFQLALRTNACSIIVCHNHPSGSLLISKRDRIETQKLYDTAQFLGIKLLDHLVITSESYTSFSDDGEL